MQTAIYTITSSLHDESAVAGLSDAFLKEIFPDMDFDFKSADFSDFGSSPFSLIYVRTGGAESIFKQLLPRIMEAGTEKIWLLTSGTSNSLAASIEILSFLRSRGIAGEILHGRPERIAARISLELKVAVARKALQGGRIGVVGKPSDWLIASQADPDAIRERLGTELVEVPMHELVDTIKTLSLESAQSSPEPDSAPDELAMKRDIRASWSGAVQIYRALKALQRQYDLSALTVRCFDLLTSVSNTGCVALSRLNAEGIPASCEGDVPALLSMMIARSLTGRTGFQANPSRIDVETGEILFAHCTIPLDIPSSVTYDTHFESGIGVGLHGEFPKGPVTVFKVSGDLSHAFIAEGQLLRNQYEDNLCRTQVVVRIDPGKARYFLGDPIGNHHILLPGHHASLLESFLQYSSLI